MGTEFWFEKMKKSWRWMVEWHNTKVLNALNCVLKSDENGKLKKIFKYKGKGKKNSKESSVARAE